MSKKNKKKQQKKNKKELSKIIEIHVTILNLIIKGKFFIFFQNMEHF